MIAFDDAQTVFPAHDVEQTTTASSTPLAPAWHSRFLAMLPHIRRHVELRFRNLKPEAREDATAEVVAHAVANYARLVDTGKEDRAFASPLASYALAAFRGGRRVGVHANARDISSPYSQQRTGAVVERLDRFDRRDSRDWQEVLVEDRNTGPAEVAATRIDFSEWLTTLPERNRRIAETLATGECTSRVAKMFGISAGRIAQLRRELCDAWKDYQGERAPATL
jgi:hypothetical protein